MLYPAELRTHEVVLQAGLEPARFFKQKILSLLCLPIPPPELISRVVYHARAVSRARSAGCLAPSVICDVKERCCLYYKQFVNHFT